MLESESETITQVSEPATKDTTDAGSSIETASDRISSVAILVRYPYVETLPENEKNLLEKILKSVSIDINEITITNVDFGRTPDKSDLENYTHVLIFDNDPYLMVSLKLPGELYKQHQIGKTYCIIADPLESIHEDTAKKSRLWKALQIIFDI